MTVVGFGILLQRYAAAGGAGTAAVQPVTVGIQAVLDMAFMNPHIQASSKRFGFFPSSYFHSKQFKITQIVGMAQYCVAGFVQQRPAPAVGV